MVAKKKRVAGGFTLDYETFFQALWIAPDEGAGERTLTFKGTASGFTYVVRSVTEGTPLGCVSADLVSGAVTIDLTSYTASDASIVMYLFGSYTDGDQFAQDISGGWTEDDMRILTDPQYLHYVPDVDFTPQIAVRAARMACDPENPESVEEMNEALDLIYAQFTGYDGHVLPDVREGFKGTSVAAPGDPPTWIPP